MKKFLIIIFFYLTVSQAVSKDIQKIVVIGRKEPFNAENTPYALTTITADDIKKSGARNITDVLNKITGINFYKYGSSSALSKISIRGSSNEQILVLINGERINTSTGGGIDFSTINVNSIKRIEVIRDGVSAIYGEGAFAGIINIVTKNNEAEKNKVNIYYSYGSFKTHSIGFTAGTVYKKFLNYFVSGDLLISDGGYLFENQKHGTMEKRINTGITSGEIDSRLLFKKKNNKLILGFRYYRDIKGIPGSIEFPSYSATMYDKFLSLNILYQKIYENLTGSIGISFQNMYRRFTDDKFFLGKIDDTNDSYIYSGILKINYKFKTLFSQNIGTEYNYRNENLESTALEKQNAEVFNGKIEKTAHSFRFSDDMLLIKKILILKTAIRYDIFKRYKNKPSYYIGSNIKFDKKKRFILKLSVGSAYRTPSFQDLFLPDTGFAVGNPDLQPEESVNYNIGTIFKLYDWLSTEINFFKKYTSNLIQWNPGPGGKWRPKNISKVNTAGIEYENKALFFINFIVSYLELTYNYTLLFVTDKSGQPATDGKQLPLKPFETANFIFTLTKSKKFSIQFESHFVGFRYLTSHNTKYLDAYLIHNINTIIYYKNTEFSFLMKNITQEKYIDIRGFPIPGMELYFKIGIKL